MYDLIVFNKTVTHLLDWVGRTLVFVDESWIIVTVYHQKET